MGLKYSCKVNKISYVSKWERLITKNIPLGYTSVSSVKSTLDL